MNASNHSHKMVRYFLERFTCKLFFADGKNPDFFPKINSSRLHKYNILPGNLVSLEYGGHPRSSNIPRGNPVQSSSTAGCRGSGLQTGHPAVFKGFSNGGRFEAEPAFFKGSSNGGHFEAKPAFFKGFGHGGRFEAQSGKPGPFSLVKKTFSL
jgi:hypothetical protein